MLPGDLATTTVTGTLYDCAGEALAGRVTFTPSAPVSDATGEVVIPQKPRGFWLLGGRLSATIAATDNANLAPAGWDYIVTVEIDGLLPYSFSALIPHAPSPVDLSALTG